MAKVNQLRAGVWLSYLNMAIGTIIPLIYTPIMLDMLGQAEYGTYSLANSVMGYIGLLNFGLGSTMARYITKYRAEDNKDKEQRVIGLFTVIFMVIGLLTFIIGTVVGLNLDVFYGNTLTADELSTMKTLVLLLTFNTGIFLPCSVFASITISHERYIFNRVMNIVLTCVSPCVNLVVLYMGFKSVGLVIASTIVSAFVNITYILYSYKKLNIMPKFKNMPFGMLKEILVFSFFIFLGQIVDTLYWTTDKVIIGATIGTVAVAVYNVGSTFNSYITQISTTISGVLVPKVTTMVTKNATKEQLTEIFIRVGRLQFIVVSFITSAFIAYGKPFISLWTGPEYGEAYAVALLVMLPLTVPLIQNTGISILVAQNKHSFRSTVYAIIAVFNVVLTLILVGNYGIVGAAFATCFGYVVGQIFIMNWYYHKKIGINIPLFWLNILKMSPVMIITMLVGLFVNNNIFMIDSWIEFLISAIVFTIIYAVCAYFIMMNDYEKDIFRGPVKRIFAKFSSKKSEG